MYQKIIQLGLIVAASTLLSGMKKNDSRVRLAWENPPRTIDPRFTTDANSHYLSDLINCSLINFDVSGRIVGQLAKSWKWQTNKQLRVEMRPAATFSDGTPVEPEDVIATYDFFKKEGLKKPSPLAGAYKQIKSITHKGHTLTFNFEEADASFLQNLVMGILPKKFASMEMFDKPGSYVGCGPFTLTAMGVSGLTLKRNPKYSLGPPPKLDSIEIKIVKDELTRFSKLRKGEIDLVQNSISREKVPSLTKKYPALQVHKKAGLNVTYLGFNMKDKILANPRVRQAIAMAINRDDIIKYILRGMAVPARSMLTPEDPYLNKQVAAVPFQPKQAMKLLDEAGFKDPDGNGEKMRFAVTYKTTTNVMRISIAQAIASQLKTIGVGVKVQSLEWGKFKADVEAGRVQLWSLSWVGFKDPDIYRYAFASASFPPKGGNRGWYSNKELDKLLAEAKVTADIEKRRQLYQKIQVLVAKDLPYVFLWHEENFAVHNKKLSGFRLFADGRLSSLTEAKVQ